MIKFLRYFLCGGQTAMHVLQPFCYPADCEANISQASIICPIPAKFPQFSAVNQDILVRGVG